MALLGYFIFTDLGDGCLASKYGNTDNVRLFSEATILEKQPSNTATSTINPFLGDFWTIWFDSDTGKSDKSFLTIKRKPASTSQYILKWQDPKTSKTKYHGEGMLYNGILSGAYWDEQTDNILSKNLNDTKE